MQRHFKISQILIYYDMPELVIATDDIGVNYICLLIDDSNNRPLYYATPISPPRLSNFIKGKIGLREILAIPEISEWYSFAFNNEDTYAEKLNIDTFPEQHLPDDGLFLNEEMVDDSSIIEDVIQKENAVVHLAISDAENDFGISMDDLGDVVKLYSIILENSFKKSIVDHKFKDKKGIIIPMNYELRAFASSRASFNIHLYSQSQKDLFGTCIIEFGLEKIDQILTEHTTDEELIESLKSVRGHAISSFKKLLKKIIDKNLKIKHKWFAPNQKEIHFRMLEASGAQKIYDILNQSEELTEETKVIIGVFVQADVERGTWRIKSIEDGAEYSGEATSDELRGITLDTIEYKLICQEIIEEFRVTEKEKVKYIFKSVVLQQDNPK